MRPTLAPRLTALLAVGREKCATGAMVAGGSEGTGGAGATTRRALRGSLPSEEDDMEGGSAGRVRVEAEGLNGPCCVGRGGACRLAEVEEAREEVDSEGFIVV